MTVSVVAALGDNRAIGRDGALLWRLRDDLRHFKQVTLGHPIIMGRATWDSIGRPLPGRTTIVVTRQPTWRAADADAVVVAHSLDEALGVAAGLDDQTFVVGGGRIYAEAIGRDLVDRLVLTQVADAPQADTFFPDIDPSRWRETGRSDEHAGPPTFRIVTLERVS